MGYVKKAEGILGISEKASCLSILYIPLSYSLHALDYSFSSFLLLLVASGFGT